MLLNTPSDSSITYDRLILSTDLGLFESFLMDEWKAISTWNPLSDFPTEEERVMYAGTSGVVYRNYASEQLSMDVVTESAEGRKSVWDMVVESVNVPDFLKMEVKDMVFQTVSNYHAQRDLDTAPSPVLLYTSFHMNHVRTVVRALKKTISIVDFSRLLEAGWEVDHDYDELQGSECSFEVRKPVSANTDSVMIITSRKFGKDISSFEMLRQALKWEGTVDEDVRLAFLQVDHEDAC